MKHQLTRIITPRAMTGSRTLEHLKRPVRSVDIRAAVGQLSSDGEGGVMLTARRL